MYSKFVDEFVKILDTPEKTKDDSLKYHLPGWFNLPAYIINNNFHEILKEIGDQNCTLYIPECKQVVIDCDLYLPKNINLVIPPGSNIVISNGCTAILDCSIHYGAVQNV